MLDFHTSKAERRALTAIATSLLNLFIQKIMKNIIVNALIILGVAIAFSTTSLGQAQMVKGTTIVQAGIGLGGWTTAYTTSETPLLSATFEKGIKDDFGPGNLSIGGTIAYKSGRSNGLGYHWNYNYTAIAGRATWHPHFINSEKWNVYTGLSLGLHRAAVQSDFTDFDLAVSETSLVLAAYVGARYYFNENWAAYTELGYGLGALNIGVAYKIK